MFHPKVSIITVVYNRASTIEKAIRSVLGQDYDNLEYIIIDGNSTDGTVDIIRKYEHKISKWISESDNGIYDAMNKGIAYATGDIISFLNSDDWYMDNAILNVVERFEKQEFDILFMGVTREDKNGIRINRYPEIRKVGNKHEHLAVFHAATFASRNIFKEIGRFDITYRIAADYDWLVRMKNHGYVIEYGDQITTYYSDGGISNKYWKEAQEEARQIDLKYAQSIEEQEIINKLYEDNKCKKLYFDILNQNALSNIYAIDIKKYVNKEVYIFGAGNTGKECYQLLWQSGVIIKGFIDNDQAKWGELIEGCGIMSPKVIDTKNDFVVVASVLYEKEIERYLSKIGVQTERIVTFSFLKNKVMDRIKREEYLV